VSVYPLLQPSPIVPRRFWQQVYIANLLSVIFSGLTILLLAVLLRDFGWNATTPFIIGIAILFIVIIFINQSGFYKIGRLTFCIVPVLLTMFLTVYMKIVEPQSYITYFDSRYILLASTILPAIVFRLEERSSLIVSVSIIAICLLLFDFIHEIFGVGYFQKGYGIASYSFIGYVVAVSFIILLCGIFLLRSVTEKAERTMMEQNASLLLQQIEVRRQHEELLLQREELMVSSERLEEANRLIHRQKMDLERYASNLEHSVQETSDELFKTNEALVKRNNDLMQFSYTLSHNLRGPVARLLGLTNLAKRTSIHDDINELISKSAQDLDEVLRDLGQILDMGTEIYAVKENVSLPHEWSRAVRLLEDKISDETIIEVNFDQPTTIWGVKAMVQSVFYNLLSNALKYKSPERRLHIQVKSLRKSNALIIEFSDNGIGIDLDSYGKDIFKLYKRFHESTHGKGVGLYLVKMQVESMNGNITVQSKVNIGTTFRMNFFKDQ
jgi:signal transduction histidine kinase